MELKFKKLLVFIPLFAIVIVVILNLSLTFNINDSLHYTNILIDIFDEQQKVRVNDVFAFNFDRAYIFNDCYISGEGFTERYNLKLSIEEVDAGVSENIHRIVFVDKNGDFIFEYKCDANQVSFDNESLIIYPTTQILKCDNSTNDALSISFMSKDYY